MGFIKFVFAILYTLVSAYLIWLLFYWLVPWLMGFGWLAAIIYWILSFGLIAATFKLLSGLIASPLFGLVGRNKFSGVFAIVIYALFAVSAVLLPWMQPMKYRLITIIIGVSLSLTALSVYGAVINTVAGNIGRSR